MASQLTPRQRARLRAIHESYLAMQVARAEMVKHVIAAFNEKIPAHRIGDAMDMSEAGARQIRKRRR